jgi:hypothetical protein
MEVWELVEYNAQTSHPNCPLPSSLSSRDVCRHVAGTKGTHVYGIGIEGCSYRSVDTKVLIEGIRRGWAGTPLGPSEWHSAL